MQNGCKSCRFALDALQNEMPSGRARNVSRFQIRLGGMCFLVTTGMEIALGEAKFQHCPSQLLTANFVQVRDNEDLLSYLFAINFRGLLEIWHRRVCYKGRNSRRG